MSTSQTTYWDSSALIKRYIDEKDSNKVLSLFTKSNIHITSCITHAEIISTFYRLKRENYINNTELESLLKSFTKEWNMLNIIQYNNDVQETAQNIADKSALRGADLIHLSSACRLKQEGLEIKFITFDKRLENAAIDLKLNLVL